MTELEQRLLIITAIDGVLTNEFGYYSHLTSEQRDRVVDRVGELMENKSVRDVREKLVILATQLYAELFPDEQTVQDQG